MAKNTASTDNFMVITTTIVSATSKPSGYTTGLGRFGGKKNYPIALAAANGAGKALIENVGQTVILMGSLAISKKDDKEAIYFHVTSVKPAEEHSRNFAKLTLNAIKDGECRYTKEGKLWAFARAMLSMGKDEATGKWKPAIFLTLKGFARELKEEDGSPKFDGEGNQAYDELCPIVIANLVKRQSVTVKGSLSVEMYKDRPFWAITAYDAQPGEISESLEEPALDVNPEDLDDLSAELPQAEAELDLL